jgi:methylmalonyl-CoA/ethylmalonyl-CoA epimerase
VITKLSHVGIAVSNIKEAEKLWTQTYGLKVSRGGMAEVEGIKNVFLAIGDNLIELMEPINHQDMSNAIARRLAARGDGIYQIAIVVDNMEQEVKNLTQKGVTLIKRPQTPDQPQGRWVVHPKSANGVLLELITR